jgi:hypothetical protein
MYTSIFASAVAPLASSVTAITPTGNVQPSQLAAWNAPSRIPSKALSYDASGNVGWFPATAAADSLIGLT